MRKKEAGSRKKEVRRQEPEARRRKAAKPEGRKPKAKGSKKKAEGRSQKTEVRSQKTEGKKNKKQAESRKPKGPKVVRLDLSKFPAESVTQMERGICLACVWEVFTRHLKLAPKTALGEIRRYTPPLEELNAAAAMEYRRQDRFAERTRSSVPGFGHACRSAVRRHLGRSGIAIDQFIAPRTTARSARLHPPLNVPHLIGT